MNEFDKDLKFVKDKYTEVIHPDDLSKAKSFKRWFVDKYTVLISPLDKTFIKIQNELNELEQEVTKKISSAYYFRK